MLGDFVSLIRDIEMDLGAPEGALLTKEMEETIKKQIATTQANISADRETFLQVYEQIQGIDNPTRLLEKIAEVHDRITGGKAPDVGPRIAGSYLSRSPSRNEPPSPTTSLSPSRYTGRSRNRPTRLTAKPDVGEEDALTRGTTSDDSTFQEDSTVDLDLPSTAPVRGTTPEPVVFDPRGTPMSPRQAAAFNITAASVDMSGNTGDDDSSAYEHDNIEKTVLQPHTDLTPRRATQRPGEEIARVYAECRRLGAVVEAKNRANAELEVLVQQYKRQYESVRERAEDTQQTYGLDLENIRIEYSKAQEEIATWKEKIAKKDRNIGHLENQLSDLNAELKSLKDETDKNKRNVHKEFIERKELKAQVLRTKRELEQQQEQFKTLEFRLQRETKKVEELKEDALNAEEQIVKLEGTIDEQYTQIEELKEENENLRIEIAALQRSRGENRPSSSGGGDIKPGLGFDDDEFDVSFEDAASQDTASQPSRRSSRLSGGYKSRPVSLSGSGDSAASNSTARSTSTHVPPGVGQKQMIEQTTFMNWDGVDIQTDITIPPMESRSALDAVAWLEDPVMAAIAQIKQQMPDNVGTKTTQDIPCQTDEAWPKVAIEYVTVDAPTNTNVAPIDPEIQKVIDMGPIDVELQKLAQEYDVTAADIRRLLEAEQIDEEIQQLIHQYNLTAARIQEIIDIGPVNGEIQKLLNESDLTVEDIRKLLDAHPIDEELQQLIRGHSLTATNLRKLLDAEPIDEEILRLIHQHSLTATNLRNLLEAEPIDEEIQQIIQKHNLTATDIQSLLATETIDEEMRQLIHEHNLNAARIRGLIDAERAGTQTHAASEGGEGAVSVPVSPTETASKSDKGEGQEKPDEPMDAATSFANAPPIVKAFFASLHNTKGESSTAEPTEPYGEIIYTTLGTRQQLRELVAKENLTIEDVNFLNDFVQEQSSEPDREILRNLWLASQQAARAARKAAAKLAPPHDSFAGLHLVNSPLGILAWPWRLLWEQINSLDQADYRATAEQSEQRVTDSLREEFRVEREAEQKQEETLDPLTSTRIPRRAPVGIKAALLRAGPKPSVAWSIVTVGLYLLLFGLLLWNVFLYHGIKMDQRQWERSNEPPYKAWAGVVGGGSSCWKVCANDGWGWRWRAYLREFVYEAGRGAWPS
jgi:predicted  nucleic acid-binding Zn-ribbon protein